MYHCCHSVILPSRPQICFFIYVHLKSLCTNHTTLKVRLYGENIYNTVIDGAGPLIKENLFQVCQRLSQLLQRRLRLCVGSEGGRVVLHITAHLTSSYCRPKGTVISVISRRVPTRSEAHQPPDIPLFTSFQSASLSSLIILCLHPFLSPLLALLVSSTQLSLTRFPLLFQSFLAFFCLNVSLLTFWHSPPFSSLFTALFCYLISSSLLSASSLLSSILCLCNHKSDAAPIQRTACYLQQMAKTISACTLSQIVFLLRHTYKFTYTCILMSLFRLI